MNRFCENCGRPLQEGEVCNCTANNMNNNTINNNMNNTTNNYIINNTSNMNNTSINNVKTNNTSSTIIDILKNIFIKPTEVLKNNINDNNLIIGIIIIIITCIIKSIDIVLSTYIAYSKLGTLEYTSAPNYFITFIKAFSLSVVRYIAIIAMIYLVINIIFKDKVSWKKLVVAVGISLIVIIFGNILYCMLDFSDAKITTYIVDYISSFITIFNCIILYEAIKNISTINKNKIIISLPIVYIVSTMLVDILNKIIS